MNGVAEFNVVGHAPPRPPARRRAWRPVLLSVCLAAVVGCSGEQHQDLRSYVEQVKSRPGGRVAPLPEVKRYESFAYAAIDLRDPFVATFKLEDPQQNASNNGIRPDVRRKREALEAFSLDSLALVGHLEKDGQHWALVSAPDGTVHRVQTGNYLGQNYGEIVAVTESRLELKEIVPDGLGGWIERPATLALSE